MGRGKYLVKISLRVTQEMDAYIEALARELKTSKSEAIRTLIEFASTLDPEKVKKYYEKLRLD